MVALLELGWRSVAERFEQAAAVVPCDPLERRELDVLEPVLRQKPRPATLGFEFSSAAWLHGEQNAAEVGKVAARRLRSLRETLTRRGGAWSNGLSSARGPRHTTSAKQL